MALDLRLDQHLLEECRGDLPVQQLIPVFHEDGHISHGCIRIQSDKPAKQLVIVQLRHQEPVTPNAIAHLQ